MHTTSRPAQRRGSPCPPVPRSACAAISTVPRGLVTRGGGRCVLRPYDSACQLAKANSTEAVTRLFDQNFAPRRAASAKQCRRPSEGMAEGDTHDKHSTESRRAGGYPSLTPRVMGRMLRHHGVGVPWPPKTRLRGGGGGRQKSRGVMIASACARDNCCMMSSRWRALSLREAFSC